MLAQKSLGKGRKKGKWGVFAGEAGLGSNWAQAVLHS